MGFYGFPARRLLIISLVAVAVACPYAIPIPWLSLSRWLSGHIIENPGFLPAPLDNQIWFVVFSAGTIALAAGVLWRWKRFDRGAQRGVVIAGCIWFVITLTRGVLAPKFQSLHQELLLQGALMIFFAVAAGLMVSSRRLAALQLALVAGAMPLAVIALMQNAGIDPLPYSAVVPGTLEKVTGKHLISSTFGHPNYMGSYLAPILLLGLGVTFSGRHLSIRGLGLISAILCGLALLVGGTRGPLLAVAAGGIVYFGMNRWGGFSRRQMMMGAGIILICLVGGAGLLFSGLTYDISERLLASKEIASRAFYWLVGMEMFRGSPLFGVGAGQFDNQFWWVVSQMPSVESGGPWYFMMDSVVRGVRPGYMHNDHLQVLVESGLVGAFAWACLWAAIVRGFIKVKHEAVGGDVGLNAAFAGAFAAICVDAIFGFPFHLPCSGALFWIGLGFWAGWKRKTNFSDAL